MCYSTHSKLTGWCGIKYSIRIKQTKNSNIV